MEKYFTYVFLYVTFVIHFWTKLYIDAIICFISLFFNEIKQIIALPGQYLHWLGINLEKPSARPIFQLEHLYPYKSSVFYTFLS